MKKVLYILIPSILLSLVFFLTIQFIVSQSARKGALQVTADPEASVYLNNSYIGKTPLCKCDSGQLIPVGDYTIRIVPNNSSLGEFQEQITISEAVLTVVDRKFAQDSLSDGSIISLSPLTDSQKTELLIVSIPEKSQVYLDNNLIGTTPLLFSSPTVSDHIIEVTKDGYSAKTIRIRTPLGYKLTLQAYLGTDPDSSFVNAYQPTPTSVVSTTPTPGTTQEVTILNTPTGFLRVRQSPNTQSADIGEAYPGETHPLISKQNGWYEIQLSNGTAGWVSSEYAQVQ